MTADRSISDAEAVLFRGADEGTLGHAYLLLGSPYDLGMPFAGRILQYLYCTGRERPCGRCGPCRRVTARSHPDVTWVEPESKGRVIKVETVREVRRKLWRRGTEGEWKGLVVCAADRMPPIAANAFLKCLEEPPGQTLILLLSEHADGLLPTIRSRCQLIRLGGGETVEEGPWRESLLELLRLPPSFDTLARMRRAVLFADLLEGERNRIRETLAQEDPGVDAEQHKARVESRLRRSRLSIVRAMLYWQRDVLCCAWGQDAELLNYRGEHPVISRQAEILGRRGAQQAVRAIEVLQRRLERSMPAAIVYEDALAAMVAGLKAEAGTPKKEQ